MSSRSRDLEVVQVTNFPAQLRLQVEQVNNSAATLPAGQLDGELARWTLRYTVRTRGNR